MKIKRLLLILAAFTLASCTNKSVAKVESTTAKVEMKNDGDLQSTSAVKLENLKIVDIEKYGNIVLPVSATELLNSGFSYEDIVTVSFLDKKIDMPICETFFDVDNGDYVLIAEINKDNNVDKAIIAITMGDFATTYNLATKSTGDNGVGYKWNYINDSDKTCTFTIELKEKGGYHEEHLAHKLIRTNNREDYKNLTDEEYANFRMVKINEIGENKLYRSSSPVNPEISRNTYAMKATEDHGIKSIVNLADTELEVKAMATYKDSYYSKQNVLALGLNVDFNSNSFKEGIAKIMHFISTNEAPYLIHCNEGKDRAGYIVALLECLVGASFDEVTNDYMITYYNYYNVLPGTEQYKAIIDKRITKQLEAAFGVTELSKADLSKLCENYLLSVGVAREDIQTVKLKLQ